MSKKTGGKQGKFIWGSSYTKAPRNYYGKGVSPPTKTKPNTLISSQKVVDEEIKENDNNPKPTAENKEGEEQEEKLQYSVKYIGIVNNDMGILTKKVPLPDRTKESTKVDNVLNPAYKLALNDGLESDKLYNRNRFIPSEVKSNVSKVEPSIKCMDEEECTCSGNDDDHIYVVSENVDGYAVHSSLGGWKISAKNYKSRNRSNDEDSKEEVKKTPIKNNPKVKFRQLKSIVRDVERRQAASNTRWLISETRRIAEEKATKQVEGENLNENRNSTYSARYIDVSINDLVAATDHVHPWEVEYNDDWNETVDDEYLCFDEEEIVETEEIHNEPYLLYVQEKNKDEP